MKSQVKSLFICLALVFAAGCAADAIPEETSQPPVGTIPTCEGPKCDGFSDRFRDAYSDMKRIDLEDLSVLGAGLATDQLNDALSGIPYTQLALEPTAVYGVREEVFGQVTVHDLSALSAGLTYRLGEDAFATRVVEMREREAARADARWAESRFTIGPELGHDWRLNAGDTVGTVGFDASASVETVVIAPYSDSVDAVTQAPLSSIRETRGWILPRSLNDVEDMRPGESLSMSARGALGFNLGVGVPFLIGTVADLVSLRARLSFGARVALDGQLDVQLVRGEGNEAWVDVGMSEHDLRHFRVALQSGWGVEGLPEVDLDLGPVRLDVDAIAEKALRKQLNQKLNAEFSASSSVSNQRLTVARFKFNLGQADTELEQALAQAMRGDIRLAQALANRGDGLVEQELDLVKDSRSEADHIGFRFLGMEFYRSNNFDTGTIQIDADGQNQTLLFSELEQKSGLFFTDRDLGWRKLVSVRSEGGRLVDASVNARLTLREKDKFLTRDQMLDHVDSLASYFLGFEPLFNEASRATDALAEFVDTYCGRLDHNASFAERREFRECLDSVSTLPEVQQREDEIQAIYDQLLANNVRSGFSPDQTSAHEFAADLLEFKLALSRLNDRPDVALTGPTGQMVTQVRFSDDAIHSMMIPGREGEFRQSLENILKILASRRISDFDRKTDHIEGYVGGRRSGRLDEMSLVFFDATMRFADFDEIATSSLDGVPIGGAGSMVLIPVDNEDDLTLATIAEHKGDVLEALLPELVDLSGRGILRDLDEPGAFVVGYALMNMVEPSDIELLSSYTFDEDDFLDDVQLYSRGSAPLIDAGQFNLETLLGGQ